MPNAATVPTWWLVLSGLFFFVNIIFFAGLTFALFRLLEVAQAIKPKVDTILGRVDSIGSKVDELTETVKVVAEKIGQRAEGVASSASAISNVAATQVERFGPMIAAAATVAKIVGAAREVFFGYRGVPKRRR